MDWKKLIEGNLFKLKIVGLWPDGDSSYQRNIYTLWSIFSITIFNFCNNCSQILAIIFSNQDLGAIVSSSFLTISEVISFLKAVIMIRKMKLVKQLMRQLDNPTFQTANPNHLELVSPALKFWKVCYFTFWGMTISSVCLMCAYPFINGSRELPFKAWYPFNEQQRFVYQILYIYQIVAVFFCATVALSVDNLFAAFNVYIGAQFTILSWNIEHLVFTSKNINMNLINCIKHHKEIIRFSENVNNFGNSIIFIQFLSSAVSIGFTLFQISIVSVESSEFFSSVSFLWSVVIQVFLYCWYGNEVTIKSEEVPKAILRSKWYNAPLHVKKNLLFFLQRSQKLVDMSAFGVFYLSLDTFISILRTGYSYFALVIRVSK